MTSNRVPPSVTPPSPNEWEVTIFEITGITKDRNALVTCVAHPFTGADQGVTFVLFKQVMGMLPINGQDALIQTVVDDSHFTVAIDSTNYPSYASGGVISILTGQPPSQQQGFQIFNTPFQNVAT